MTGEGYRHPKIKRDQSLTSGYNAYIHNVRQWCYVHGEPHTWAEHVELMRKERKP